MGRYASNKPAAAPRRGSNPLWVGIVIGIVVGTGMAAGLTWYLMKSPSPFLKQEPVAEKAVEVAPPVQPASPVPGATNGKPRFEFYNVLTDKPGAKASARTTEKAPETAADKTRPSESKPGVAYVPQILQVGSFSSNGDAENLKAKLAMIGVEAHIQTATVPDKGVRYRVRLGPYKTENEMDRARNFLKQNNMDGTPMRAQ